MQLCEWHMKYNVTSCRQYKYEHRNFRKASNSRWLTDHMAPIAWLWSARGIALSSDSLLACSNLQRNVSYQHVTSLWIHAFVLRCCSFWRKIVVNVFMIVLHFSFVSACQSDFAAVCYWTLFWVLSFNVQAVKTLPSGVVGWWKDEM